MKNIQECLSLLDTYEKSRDVTLLQRVLIHIIDSANLGNSVRYLYSIHKNHKCCYKDLTTQELLLRIREQFELLSANENIELGVLSLNLIEVISKEADTCTNYQYELL